MATLYHLGLDFEERSRCIRLIRRKNVKIPTDYGREFDVKYEFCEAKFVSQCLEFVRPLTHLAQWYSFSATAECELLPQKKSQSLCRRTHSRFSRKSSQYQYILILG